MTLDGTLDATVDGDVTFTYRVENTGDTPLDIQFTSGKEGDLTVTDAESGDVVWEWGANRMFTQALESLTLAPGETREWEFVWKEPPAGEYVAEGTLEAGVDASAEISFSV